MSGCQISSSSSSSSGLTKLLQASPSSFDVQKQEEVGKNMENPGKPIKRVWENTNLRTVEVGDQDQQRELDLEAKLPQSMNTLQNPAFRTPAVDIGLYWIPALA